MPRFQDIDRDIIRLSVPTIVSNITVPLLGICDTAIAGHLGSELFLSAIAVGSVMLNVVFWIFGFLRGGTTGLTANALGAKNDSDIAKVFYRALIIAFLAGGLLISCQYPLFRSLSAIAGSTPEIYQDVETYFSIRIWGAPALLATMVISGWFVGMQSTFYPMVIAILMNIINIGASFILSFPMDYGFAGVALGTLISNWLGLMIAFGCMIWFLKGKFLKCHIRSVLQGEWWRYFAVNGNLFLRSFFIICVTMGVTSAGARLGNLTLAVNVIVMQFFQFFSFFMDGFAFSGEAMVGLHSGSRDFGTLTLCVNRLLKWTAGTAFFFSMLYLFGGFGITSLLTDSTDVIAGVMELKWCLALIPVVSCWAFIFDGFYIGITDTFKMMISALAGAALFFMITLSQQNENLQLPYLEGNNVIWTAFLAYLGIRGLYLALNWKNSLTNCRIKAL